MKHQNPFDSLSVRTTYFALVSAIKKSISNGGNQIYPITYNLPKSNLFEEAKIIIKDSDGNAEIHIKPKPVIQSIEIRFETPKYKVWNSDLGNEWFPANTEDEVWAIVDKGRLGRLYEVRYAETDELVQDFMPF